MLFGSYNNMNMLGMNNMFGSNMFGSGNVVGSLFNGTGSIFDNSFSMFGGNMFGGGCSLFTNCNGTPNYSSMAGFGVGTTLLGIGKMALSSVIQDKKANSQEAISNDIGGIQKLIDTELDKLGSGVTESNYKNFKYTNTDEYKEKLGEIDYAAKQIEGKLTGNELTNHKNTSKECADKINELKQKKTEPDADVANLDIQIKGQESIKKDADEAIAAHEKAIKAEKAIEEKRKALAKSAEAKQKNYDVIIGKITDLINKKENAQNALNEKIVDDADGNKWTRNKKLDVNTIKEGHSKFKKGDIQQLVLQFTQQPEGSKGKLQYAQALKNLDGTTFINMANNSQIKVREWAMDYCEKHKAELA